MINTIPFPRHATCIEQNVLQRPEKVFSKFYSKMTPIDVKCFNFTYSEFV